MTDTCSTCRFWDYDGDCMFEAGEPMERYGRCARFPPFGRKLIVLIKDREEYLDVNDGWPLVLEGDWCGEWQQAEPTT